MGKPKKYDTPAEAAEDKKKQNRESYARQKANNPEKLKAKQKVNNEIQREKINSDPNKKAKVNAQKKASKDKKKILKQQLICVLSAILEFKSNETSANFQKALKTVKQFQQQVSCEPAEQLEFFK